MKGHRKFSLVFCKALSFEGGFPSGEGRALPEVTESTEDTVAATLPSLVRFGLEYIF